MPLLTASAIASTGALIAKAKKGFSLVKKGAQKASTLLKGVSLTKTANGRWSARGQNFAFTGGAQGGVTGQVSNVQQQDPMLFYGLLAGLGYLLFKK